MSPHSSSVWDWHRPILDRFAPFLSRMGEPPAPVPVIPDPSWTKARIIEWLSLAGVTVTDKAAANLSKDELLDMVSDVQTPGG